MTTTPQRRRRIGAEHDPERMAGRLSVLWFAAALGGAIVSPALFAAVLAGTAGVGALQVARAWRRLGAAVDEKAATAVAVAVPFLALGGPVYAGLAFLAVAIVALVWWRGGGAGTFDVDRTLGCCLPVALAASCPVLLVSLDESVGVAFLLLISGYDAADYVFGIESRRHYAGPVAGMVTVMVLSLPLMLLDVTPLGGELAWYAMATAVGAPVGQAVASASIPRRKFVASGLRRLDSYLLAAPLWVGMLWSGIGTGS